MRALDARVLSLDIQRIPQSSIRYLVSSDLSNEGDSFVGALIGWNMTHGAKTFGSNPSDCGCMWLMGSRNEVVKVSLEKGQLATAVLDALLVAEWHIGSPLTQRRTMVRITYLGKHESGYKRYEVTVGIARNNELHHSLFVGSGSAAVEQREG